MELIHVPESAHRFSTKKAKAILSHKPDIVLFELPQGSVLDLNKYEPLKKPKEEILRWEVFCLSGIGR